MCERKARFAQVDITAPLGTAEQLAKESYELINSL